jgi:multiple sugar transport system substrate-binding protein
VALQNHPEAKDDPWMAIVAERIVPYAVSETFYPFGINIAFGNAMERVYLQGADINESFEIAHKEIQDIIANESLAGKNPKAQ